MWLLPVLSALARAASHIYYRVRFTGPSIPAGPVLLVANHPNSLLDPTLVVAAGSRPVRFLAKAPLFSDRKIGWLVKATGAIPVYRRADDPALMAKNDDAFRAVFDVLARGAVVGIFPEGISHSDPSIAPLKTGAARIALGAAERLGGTISIVPVGLSFRAKEIFRSDAYVVRGFPLAWGDLASRGPDDTEAVRELTSRIDAALRGVTVNLTSWEDQPVVECAVRVWEAEGRTPSRDAERLSRMEFTTATLARVRATNDPAGLDLVADVRRHDRRLRWLGLRPSDLVADVGAERAVTWAVRRLFLLLPLGMVVATVGAVLFWVPYQLTGIIVNRLRLQQDVQSTWKLLIGIVLYLAWLVALVVLIGAALGWLAALASVIAIPAVAVAGLHVRENWRSTWHDARRFFFLRSRADLVETLRQEQTSLAGRLDAIRGPGDHLV
jgi:glycerol-3-phosphate O-acyltransferase / dihydroxyacetone phosphate acyltransferase